MTILLTAYIPQIYCDMDGVLSDFDKQVKIMGLERGSFMNDDFWDSVVSQNYKFWNTMPVMPDAQKLWFFIQQFNPRALSAPLDWRGEFVLKECAKAKRDWLKRHISLEAAKQAIIDSDKISHLRPGDILIDDMEKNITSWQQAGGVGILHKDPQDTISKLQEILKIH